ncbi:HAD-IB family hydrolase [Pseudofrankia saprophytica]|uniref:HAD-IB family hydrolase n=1 Tax=Pseudofrankia saprophytica TaxID=298655 RepID=UPI000234D6FF|nr:HAD-IB family hydrolase [Pseudofrankia saprophytica]
MGLRERLAGRRVYMTGVTGFVGEALLERLLSDFPDTRVVALVRPRGGQDGASRLRRQLRKPAFKALREKVGEGAVEKLAARVEVVDGDLASMPDIPADVDLVIHCAGEVSFDPPVDEGFTTNIGGVQELLRAARAGGASPHIVHVSTAYVAGLRSGHIAEGRLAHDVDWVAEKAAAGRTRQAAEDASRTPERSAQFLAEAQAKHLRAGAQSVSRDAEDRRRQWVRDRLVRSGAERAQVLGWTDCYTFTKALAERCLEDSHGDLPLTIVRPSIIESALARPFPGWIEGFKMAEPLILAYGRGEFPDFPASPDATIDIIPVDLVVNAILAAAAQTPPAAEPAYYTVCSGFRNPLLFRELFEHVHEYFQEHPLPKRGRGPIAVPEWPFAGARAAEAKLRNGERVAAVAGRVLEHAPRSEKVRRWAQEFDRFESRVGFLRRYADIYRAYTKAELVYVDDATKALFDGLDEADQADFNFDPACYDWYHYLQEVHFPAVTAILRRPRDPAPPKRSGVNLPANPDALAVFDLDGTLVTSTVIESYLWLRLADEAPAGRARELAGLGAVLPRFLRAERTDRGHLIRSVYARYKGADPEELARIIDEVAGDILLRRVKPAAIRRVRAHRQAGHRTVLLTGSVDFLVRPLAPLFDEVVASKLTVGADGLLTGKLASSPLVGDARAAFLDHFAGRVGADLSSSWAYGDSQSDIPMLRAVGNPVAVNPDLALFRLAKANGWAVEEWPSTPGEPRAVVPSLRERSLFHAARTAAATLTGVGTGAGAAGRDGGAR